MKFTNEQKQFVINNVKGISLKELTERFNKEFKTNRDNQSLANLKHRLNLKSGISGGQFEKGNIPHNKNKKWDDYLTKEMQEKCKKTWYKKGNITHNHREIGSERLTRDGFVEIKVAEPNVWKIKARYIYEQEYGEIPKGYKIIYLDGNQQNLELNNLKLVSNAEELIMNKNKLRFNNKELTESGLLIAKIKNKRGKLKK